MDKPNEPTSAMVWTIVMLQFIAAAKWAPVIERVKAALIGMGVR
jgi:hypothetical protein